MESSQLLETLERYEGENLQLSWPSEGQEPVLEVIVELYDDHIELTAKPPVAENVKTVLAKLEKDSSAVL